MRMNERSLGRSCVTTALTALFCSVIFSKTSQSLMASYLIIITLFIAFYAVALLRSRGVLPARLRLLYLADGDRHGRVSVPALDDRTAVDRDDVAVLDHPPAGDAVDHLLVDRGAYDRGVAVIAEKGARHLALLDLGARGVRSSCRDCRRETGGFRLKISALTESARDLHSFVKISKNIALRSGSLFDCCGFRRREG